MYETDDRSLDFRALLTELQGFLGDHVVIESSCAGASDYHESRGILDRSVDMHVALSRPLEQPAHISFCLAGAGARFTLRERAVREARAWSVIDDEGARSRYVLVLFTGGGELVVRDEWERTFLERHRQKREDD